MGARRSRQEGRSLGERGAGGGDPPRRGGQRDAQLPYLQGLRGRPQDGGRPCAPRWPLPRRALAGEGDRDRLGGAAEHQRLPLLQGRRVDERQRAGEARQAGGLRAARQVELAGGRLGALHRAQDVWPDRQSLGYDADSRRLIRRLCGSGRGPRAAAKPKRATAAAPSARRRATPASSASSPRAGASRWRRVRTSGTAA